jgi:hypothetical protein
VDFVAGDSFLVWRLLATQFRLRDASVDVCTVGSFAELANGFIAMIFPSRRQQGIQGTKMTGLGS